MERFLLKRQEITILYCKGLLFAQGPSPNASSTYCLEGDEGEVGPKRGSNPPAFCEPASGWSCTTRFSGI